MSKRYGQFNENGECVGYVHASSSGDVNGFELPLGHTLRDMDGTVIEFDDPADIIIAAIRADLDSLEARITELEELKHG